jgi:hypothetical protein
MTYRFKVLRHAGTAIALAIEGVNTGRQLQHRAVI